MRRSLSLRVRVAVASALATTVVVVLVGVLASVLLVREQTERLDRSLSPGAGVTGAFASTRADLAVTTRTSAGAARAASGPVLPLTPVGIPTSVTVDGVDYRVRTGPGPTPGSLVTVGATEDDTRARVAERRRLVVGVGVAAVALAAGLGWLLAGRAVGPLRRLTERARDLDADDGPVEVRADGSRESEELAETLTAALARLDDARRRSAASLDAARDFAAAARHELRTPLTAMRTDLEVLRDHPDLPERAEVLAEVLRAQERVEATLTALGQLAAGDLAAAGGDGAPGVVVADLLRLAAEDARRAHPALRVRVDEPLDGTPASAPGSLEGLRMALANTVTNAVRHGRATRVWLRAEPGDQGGVDLVVDDDGTGLPPAERERVLGRFVRGSTASAPGSGLGLALVAQQAQRHGGSVRLADAPTGGLRVILRPGPPPV